MASSPVRREQRGPRRPRGVLKWAFHLPSALYRLHLGWLLGHHALLLTHRGRRSGRLHHTVLEVVRYDPRIDESVVFSAYGDRSDWYRNIQAAPVLEVRTGRSRYVPEQRQLDPEESYAVLVAYRRRFYGPLLGLLLRYLGYPYSGRDDELRAVAARMPAVGFRPRGRAPDVPKGRETTRRRTAG